MSGILGGGSKATQVTTYSGLQVQTTSAAVPVPIVYGCNVLSPNCFWYNDFSSHPVSGKGGKGGIFSGGSSQQTLDYDCSIMMGLCEGPINGIGQIMQSSNTWTSLAALNLSAYYGTSPQDLWPFLTSNHSDEALAYPGIAYVCSAYYDLGSGATIGSNIFEIYGTFYQSGCNGVDADPALVIQDFLTNIQYGVGFPAASIDTTALLGGSGTGSYQAYCWAVGLAISPALNDQESASSILERWLQITNSTAVWSEGKLKIIPYGDQAVTGNGQTWVPDTAVVYALTDDDIVAAENEDPVKIAITDPFAASNQQSVEILSRSDQYNSGPITTFDQGMIDRFTRRIGSTVTAHEICDNNVGQVSCQLILQRGLYIRRTITFRLSWEFCLLDPMDLVAVTDVDLGLRAAVFRIIDIEEDDDGTLTITAEEYPAGVATAVLYPTQVVTSAPGNSLVAPQPVNPPIIIEPPPALSGNTPSLWVGVSPENSDPNWGGCNIYASVDGTSYTPLPVATLRGSSTMGVTTAPLPLYTGANPDTADTLSVILAASDTTLTSTTPASAEIGSTLCYVGGEYLSFTTATLTGADTVDLLGIGVATSEIAHGIGVDYGGVSQAVSETDDWGDLTSSVLATIDLGNLGFAGSGNYNLTGLYRGLEGLISVQVPSGAPFLLLTGNIVKYDISAVPVGTTLYLKFQSYNTYGAAPEDISACAVYTHEISGASVLGPVSTALGLGINLDYGRVSENVSESDDWGDLVSPVIATIDLGSLTT
jgi:hypothetical protein